MISLTQEQRERLRKSIEEWKYLLFKPEYMLGCDNTYGECPAIKKQFREYPEVFYKK